MVEMIGIALTILTALFIGYPLLQKQRRLASFELNHQTEELQARKAEIYAAIRDIDFDYRMGKLSEEDYNALREQYKGEAIKVMQALDRMSGQTYKPARVASGTHEQATRFCHHCGQPVGGEDLFCSACGDSLK